MPLGSDDQLRAVTDRLIAHSPDVLIANTGLGIRSWFGAADSWGMGAALLTTLAQTKTFARGPKASGAVHSLGLEVVARAPSERLAEAVDLALPHIGPGTVVAVQVDGSGTTPELERISALGATVVRVPVYEWKLPVDTSPAIRLARAAIAGQVHAVTFTTGPAVQNWMEIARESDIGDELLASLNESNAVLGIVGPACAETAERCGIRPERMTVPATYRLGPLVRAVADQLELRVVELTLGGHVVRLSGSVITIDEGELDLSDIDARVFAALARDPGTVISKAELLQRVWAGETTDEHLVEVAIARLRQRLGDLSHAVVTVHKRGYALRA